MEETVEYSVDRVVEPTADQVMDQAIGQDPLQHASGSTSAIATVSHASAAPPQDASVCLQSLSFAHSCNRWNR